jgi:hypothetical protein
MDYLMKEERRFADSAINLPAWPHFWQHPICPSRSSCLFGKSFYQQACSAWLSERMVLALHYRMKREAGVLSFLDWSFVRA